MAGKFSRASVVIGIGLTMALVCSALVFIAAFRLKVMEGDKWKAELSTFYREKEIPAKRGDILARDGRKLACSVPYYQTVMDPCAGGLHDSIFNKHIWTLSSALARVLGDRSRDEYVSLLRSYRNNNRQYVTLGHPIPHEKMQQLMKHPLIAQGRTKGVWFELESRRRLPFGMLAARTIGKHSDKQNRGLIGLEQSYDDVLRGKPGIGKIIRAGRHRATYDAKSPQDGRCIVSTIDIDVQDVAESSLLRQLRECNADFGVAILMEVRTGAIRAIVNLHRLPDGTYTENNFNYAIGRAVEPGSTFKLASLMACLESGKVKLDDTIDIHNGRYRIHDRELKDSHASADRAITIKQAFARSSNVGIGRMAMKCFDDDRQAFVDHLCDMGLCDSLELEIKGEKPTYMKTPADPQWSGITLPWMSMGYELTITPLQLLTFYNAVANNGTMMRPMFVEAQMEDGRRVAEARPHVIRNSIASKRTILAAQEALKAVVESGTAKNLGNTPYGIAGKTGTAQISRDNQGYGRDGEKRYVASFAGYFPADKPLYSCIVMIYGPSPNNGDYYGGRAAGPVFKDIADRIYASEFHKGKGKTHSKIPDSGRMPQSKGGMASNLVPTLAQLDIPYTVSSGNSEWKSARADENGVTVRPMFFTNHKMPNVIGMGAADAVSLLESKGLKVNVNGSYGSVKSQSIERDAYISGNESVTITLGHD